MLAPSIGFVVAAASAAAALCLAARLGASAALGADQDAFPLAGQSPRPHVVGDVYNYTLHGTLSQKIVGRDPFGRTVHQSATPTDVAGRERIAVKFVGAQGLSLHRSGSILATFNGKSSPAQSGTGWTLVTPGGNVVDRKGSTLGGLFLLPVGFRGERPVNGGTLPAPGAQWTGKLGMALFGMTAQPRLHFQVVGVRRVFGIAVYTLSAEGSAPVKEPIVTNDGVALGTAKGVAHVELRCDYDPLSLRAVSMEITVTSGLKIAPTAHGGRGSVTDRQRYLVALDAQSMQTGLPASDPPAARPAATGGPGS